jgi:hypothetical protein
MAQDPDQPRTVGGPPGKPIAGLDCGQECLLNQVLGNERILNLAYRNVEQAITMHRQPVNRFRGDYGRPV